ncbi:MAG: D-alanyl-D-alanine carboxypeptidase/D-alanyl-D-alanine-endopeptidase [Candidatus Marinimicrobia bacterium]|nr:D-alanyl-D-alanine carboxypeptidase/D-alanyl-D-alanine-endopeptidase [Candidatus Neomarinimicrobiota bacterium]MCF7830036.1 D-alanyl-D-alanine carboxypeptidase/D-alanyl-D-alanine-endopeptidase [Candidatus Neomarinimicrobiota bacterium]MCF7881924.1 D-alanyl-D-alanine carboxypeptidase/D-alanyl-D-alanine-endopeptidase [Candidatus Neomarinimicrobiota bacterium]
MSRTLYKKIVILAVLSITLTSGCTSTQVATNAEKKVAADTTEVTLQQELRQLLNHPALQTAHVGIYVQDPYTRKVVFARNEHRLFAPASNQKLLTTAAALSTLGPDFRFHTELYTNGRIENGTLYGDLYIRGTGDPTLSGRFHDGDMIRDLENWADALQELDVTRITGDIIADATMFDQDWIGTGWEYDDLSYWYAAQPGALSFNDNCLDVFITPGDSIGAPANLRYEPETDYFRMTNDLVTVHEDSITSYDYHRELNTNDMRFFGKISMSEDRIRDYITIHNPARYTTNVLRDVLTDRGISIDGMIREIPQDEPVDYKGFTQILDYTSPPLIEILNVINRRSQNLYAEQVFKRLGYEVTGKGTFEGGKRAVLEFLGKNGVDTEHLNIADGSGLSRRNLVSPAQIVMVLRSMYTGKYSDEYLRSLPIGGDNGTLSQRFRGTISERRVNAKTGYMGFVRILSGYLNTRDDHTLTFSIMVNGYTTETSVIDEIQDSIVSVIASYSYDELVGK